MKRITFVDPVDSMQGNLSGKQDLRYALNNNKAFESPKGQKNYAKNYQTRYIGARRASDGLKYFAVKTKSCTNTTAKALQAMALLGGSGAIYAALIANKSSTLYEHALLAYQYRGPEHADETMRDYLMAIIRRGLAAKQETISLSSQMSINNPWCKTIGGTDQVTISAKTIAKFFEQLGVDIIKFTVDNVVWCAWAGQTWDDFKVSSATSWGKSMSEETVEGVDYIKTSGRFIYFYQGSNVYAKAEDSIVAERSYNTTDVVPE